VEIVRLYSEKSVWHPEFFKITETLKEMRGRVHFSKEDDSNSGRWWGSKGGSWKRVWWPWWCIKARSN